MVEKILFIIEIFEIEILMDLSVLWSLESKNRNFSGLSLFLRVCRGEEAVCLLLAVNQIT